jgi:hypothetical protein
LRKSNLRKIVFICVSSCLTLRDGDIILATLSLQDIVTAAM